LIIYYKRQPHEKADDYFQCANCGKDIYKEVFPTEEGRGFCNEECLKAIKEGDMSF